MAAAQTKSIRRGLYSALTGSAQLSAIVGDRIYHQAAPKNADLPFVVFFKQSGTPTYTFGSTAFDAQSWAVKCVDRDETSDRAEDASSVVDALLTNGTLTLSAGSVMDVRRTADIDFMEPDEGQQYRHSGASYRVTVQ